MGEIIETQISTLFGTWSKNKTNCTASITIWVVITAEPIYLLQVRFCRVVAPMRNHFRAKLTKLTWKMTLSIPLCGLTYRSTLSESRKKLWVRTHSSWGLIGAEMRPLYSIRAKSARIRKSRTNCTTRQITIGSSTQGNFARPIWAQQI